MAVQIDKARKLQDQGDSVMEPESQAAASCSSVEPAVNQEQQISSESQESRSEEVHQ
jgi:hypothetical protein